MTRLVRTTPCGECGGMTAASRTLTGFVVCQKCGKLQVGEVIAEVETTDEGHTTLTDDVFDPDIPDFGEVMVGWRAWRISANAHDPTSGERPLLRGITYNQIPWEPRQEFEATCEKGQGRKNGQAPIGSHEVPEKSCTCGLYAARTREHLMGMQYRKYDAERQGEFRVVGTVSLWGKVIEASQGWRSQFAYPRELYIPFEAWQLAAPLSDAYGVPVKLNNILA